MNVLSKKKIILFTLGIFFSVLLLAVSIIYYIAHDSTIYALNFSEEEFHKIRPGMQMQEVVELIGNPLSAILQDNLEIWNYEHTSIISDNQKYEQCSLEYDHNERLIDWKGNCRKGIHKGMNKNEIILLLGKPILIHPAKSTILHYSKQNLNRDYNVRIIELDNNTVTNIIAYKYHD